MKFFMPPVSAASEDNVAPLVGAWIEISVAIFDDKVIKSLLSWERGLK